MTRAQPADLKSAQNLIFDVILNFSYRLQAFYRNNTRRANMPASGDEESANLTATRIVVSYYISKRFVRIKFNVLGCNVQQYGLRIKSGSI